MAPDISVVIVSYKVPDLLRACLASVQRETAGCTYEIVVVENASGDGSAEMVRSEFPDVRLIALEENAGFAAGCNLGARESTGEYVLLLNPDTELVGDTLLAYARAHPQAGLVGGRTLSPDGALDPGSCWGEQSLWSLVCFASGLSSVFRSSRIFNPESLGGWPRDSERQVDIVTGCLCLSPRTAWEQLGGFDESFFMYGEDADLAARARKAGFRPAITPDAVIVHHVGASSLSIDKREMTLRCRAALARKHLSPRRAEAAIVLLQAGTGLRALGATAARSSGSTWPAVWRRRRDWREGYA
jgi:N-acetylglucosaminyl-diphospho-decaprenol L-rhamnosyltransferase